MKIDAKYHLGQLVYLVTDVEQHKRMVVGITVCIKGAIMYNLACGTSETTHYEDEIASDMNVLAKS